MSGRGLHTSITSGRSEVPTSELRLPLNSQLRTLNCSTAGCSCSSQCCATGMPLESLSSKWHAAKARRGSMFLCDLRPRSNAGAGPFSTQPSGPRFDARIFASLPRPVSQRMQALRSLLQIRPKLLVAIVKPYPLHNTKYRGRWAE